MNYDNWLSKNPDDEFSDWCDDVCKLVECSLLEIDSATLDSWLLEFQFETVEDAAKEIEEKARKYLQDLDY